MYVPRILRVRCSSVFHYSAVLVFVYYAFLFRQFCFREVTRDYFFRLFPDPVFNMVSRLLIGDNNLSRFWAAFSFARPGLKSSTLMTATELDTFDHALSQVSEERILSRRL